MGKRSVLVPILSSVFFIGLVQAVSVSIPGNARALRSVTIHRRSPSDDSPDTNLLLSPDKHNPILTPVYAQRNTSEIGGGTTGDGSNDGVGIGGGTHGGSRLEQNETEPCRLNPSSLCSSEQTDSKWDKQRRIDHIVNFLWTNVFGNRTRPVNKEIVKERISPLNPSSSFSGGIQSISASCDLPSEVESEAWSTENYLNIFFNISSQFSHILGTTQNSDISPEPSPNSESSQSTEFIPVTLGPLLSTFSVPPKKTVNVVSAKLRLHKTGPVETVDETLQSEPCNDTRSDEMVPNELIKTTFPQLLTSSEEKIRVSVFWYTQPPARNHYKKRLLDVKMLSAKESRWVEFDVKNAVNAWLNDRHPNYGIVIEVENESQDTLNPRNYFSTSPCFNAESEQTTTGNIQPNSQQPILEICTLNTQTPPNEPTQIFPFSLNPESLSHLKRVALTHSKGNNASQNTSNNTQNPWQTINLSGLSVDFDSDSDQSQIQIPKPTVFSHKHRHHHERIVSGNVNKVQTPGLSLDPDHPLRGILASVKANSKESSRRSSNQQFLESFGRGQMFGEAADDSKVASDYSDSAEQNGFITKIVISPAQFRESDLRNRIASKGLSSTGAPADFTNFDLDR